MPPKRWKVPARQRAGSTWSSPRPEDANIGGAFLGLELPASVFSGGSVELVEPDPATAAQTSLAAGAAEQNEYVRAMAKGARFLSRARQIEVTFGEPTLVIVRDDRRKGSYNLQVLFAVLMGKTTAGQTGKKSFAFKVTGELDKNPVEITLDASHPGQAVRWAGRQLPVAECAHRPAGDRLLAGKHPLAWGRVEMPWSIWQPEENSDPLAAARAGTRQSAGGAGDGDGPAAGAEGNAGDCERVAGSGLGGAGRHWPRRRTATAKRTSRQSAQPREDGTHQGIDCGVPVCS